MASEISADRIFISALQHYAFCPRQCALIHVEQVWDENLYTLRGLRVHETVNIPSDDLVEGVRVERAMPLWSHRLGLTGIADVVEFADNGTLYPVEYKVGARKIRSADNVQLCAQALCLEDMFNRPVPAGAIFHHASRRRREVSMDAALRSLTLATIEQVRTLIITAQLPPPVTDARCSDCSLLEACMPHVIKDFDRTVKSNNPFWIAESL